MDFNHAFTPGSIGALTLKNRFILAPMGSGMANVDETITQEFINFHVARAKGGVGLNTVEYTSVHPTTRQDRLPGIYDDRFIPGMRKLTDAVHAAGGKISVQIWHAGRQTTSRNTKLPLIAPSAIPNIVYQEMPIEMDKALINEMIEAYGNAAYRAKQAGFDMVELHGASGYLLNQFMSAYSNKRQDEYGGSLENRARFSVEVIQRIKSKVGDDYPLSYRLTADEFVPGGLTIEDMVLVAPLLEQAGVDVIHVTSGIFETVQHTIAPIEIPPGFNADNAAAIKRAVKIPVIVVGRINDPAVAERIIAEGKADFVALGRTLIADPDFCIKAETGRVDEIIKCIACNQSCIGGQRPDPELAGFNGPVCLRNPLTGREERFTDQQAETAKKVLVIGGGAAGLAAATHLQNRGHQVILCEKSDMLGGQFYTAGRAPSKGEMSESALQMGRTTVRSGADVRLNTEVTQQLIEDLQPDEIVVATGSLPFIPNIPGSTQAYVKIAHDILRGDQTGHKVAIIGGGLVGMETAELLISQGKEVIIVEMLDEVAKELVHTRRIFALEFIAKHTISVYTNTKCTAIGEGEITLEQAGQTLLLKDIDTVVMATGAKSFNPLSSIIEQMGIPYHVIGDALRPRRALDAIYEGTQVAQVI
ncbi:MAG: FAD-dependent oxidoreductase [Gorillibacterium sp.]|nr:FAD-dependent oxidoreductase [Gorillibacterium sp.]